MPEASERASPAQPPQAAARSASLAAQGTASPGPAPTPRTMPGPTSPPAPGVHAVSQSPKLGIAASRPSPYTRPPAQYTNPIVTVHRGTPWPTSALEASRTPPSASAPPPFIISNALAAASGLGPSPARRAGTTGSPGPSAVPSAAAMPTPAAPTSAAVRLPPQKDLVAEDAELAAQRARTQQRYLRRLADDHARILQPDVHTPFRDASDVVARLLPYHVWQVPEDDLVRTMGASIVPASTPHDECAFRVPYTAKRPSTDVPHALELPSFPSAAYTRSVFRRRAQLERRLAALQTRTSTTYARAPHTTASLEHWERLLYEDEMKRYQDLSADLRRARTELEELERRRHWPGGHLAAAAPLSRDWTSASATSPAALYAQRRALDDTGAASRAYLARPAAADTRASPSSWPALSPAAVSHLAGLTAMAPAGTSNAAAQAPVPLAAPTPSITALPTTPNVPTQPLPLIVPMTCVPRLTALGIQLVPASHLLPALSLASAGQSAPMNPGLTAPRPVVGPQTEPVLLIGITEAATPLPPGANPALRQRLHLSIVLSKLRPEQLSGLAQVMQTLQAEEERASGHGAPSAAPGGAAPAAGSAPPGPARGA